MTFTPADIAKAAERAKDPIVAARIRDARYRILTGKGFDSVDVETYLARMERCRLSHCKPDEHRCLDDSEEWATFDGDAA